MNVKAVKCNTSHELTRTPGGFLITRDGGNPDGLMFGCPCGCGQVARLVFPGFRWNGDYELPSISGTIKFPTENLQGAHMRLTLKDGIWGRFVDG